MTTPPEPLRLRGAELASRLSLPGLARELFDRPLLIVEGAAPPAPALRDLPAVTVLVDADDTHADFDLSVSADALPLIDAAVTANPNAATVLVQQVRLAELLSPRAGLAAESLAYGALQGGAEHADWRSTQGRRVRPALDTPPLQVSETDAGIVVTLDRPRLRNALSTEMRDALVEVLEAAALRPGVPITITANGPAFCIGGDLAEFGTATDPAEAHRIRHTANVAPALLPVADRTTVIIDGPAVGAGVELAAFANRVEATAQASFALPEVAMGLIPGAGGTVSGPRRIGRHAFNWLALTGQRIGAPQAMRLGLVDDVR
ncbi:MAG: enoyl-CoA hydratase/isomerase family protein [Acidimicrobiales bacterium]|nr:enoyl-CoA hydratase/isomerase family protein [Acidimicrobiales bacterium]